MNRASVHPRQAMRSMPVALAESTYVFPDAQGTEPQARPPLRHRLNESHMSRAPLSLSTDHLERKTPGLLAGHERGGVGEYGVAPKHVPCRHTQRSADGVQFRRQEARYPILATPQEAEQCKSQRQAGVHQEPRDDAPDEFVGIGRWQLQSRQMTSSASGAMPRPTSS